MMCLAMTIIDFPNETAYLITDNAATRFKNFDGDFSNAKEMFDAVEEVVDLGCKIIKFDEQTALAWMTVAPVNVEKLVADIKATHGDPFKLSEIENLHFFLVTTKGGFGVWTCDDEGLKDLMLEKRPGMIKVDFQCIPFFHEETFRILGPLLGKAMLTKDDLMIKAALIQGLIQINLICPIIGPVPYVAKISRSGFTWI